MKSKWVIGFKLYECKCNMRFWSRKHLVEHLKDTKRWKQYHSFDGVKFLMHKRGCNINEAFIEDSENEKEVK